jgi:hypothetical protein
MGFSNVGHLITSSVIALMIIRCPMEGDKYGGYHSHHGKKRH